MEIRNIGLIWVTPNNIINGITSSVSHLSFPGTFLFYFPILSSTPTGSNNIYHILYDILFEIHGHQPFNQCFFLFSFVDNSFITVLILQIILFVFVIIICVILEFHIFLLSYQSVREISSLSVCEVSLLLGLSSFASFINDFNPGGNGGMCVGRLWSLSRTKLFSSWFGIVSFLDGDVVSNLIFLLFLGMLFSGATLALVYSVNPELTDISVQTIISFGAGSYDLVIKFVSLVAFLCLDRFFS